MATIAAAFACLNTAGFLLAWAICAGLVIALFLAAVERAWAYVVARLSLLRSH